MNISSFKLALFVLIALAARSSEAKYTCGPSCDCYDGDYGSSPGLKVAACFDRPGLTTVPTDLPADIQQLSIGGGSISRLSDSQFTTYRRLQLIQIYNSKIEKIEPGSVRYQTSVTVMYVTYNKISELPSECFTFLPNLVTVDLSNNKITRLQSHLFSNLKYLEQVYLYNNEINSIEKHCFAEVPQLEEIHLDNNKLISLDIKFIDNPSSLKYLTLHGNPWHCNTSLCGVMDTVVSRELWRSQLWGDQPFPTCTTAQKREWSKPLLTELCSCLPYNCTNIAPEPQPSCDVGPLIISNTSSVSEGQDLQLMCRYCLTSQVVWTFNNGTLPSNYVEKSEESITSTLTITNVVRGQQGYYLCKIRSCEDCETAGVYVSVTDKPQTDVNLKPVVDVPLEPQPSCDVGPRIISNTSSVSEGQDLQLMCQYCLTSRLVWTFNDVTLPSRYEEKSEESLTSTLTITNAVRGQQGYYLCKIKNCEDCRNDGVYVSVTGKPQSDVDLKQVVDVPPEPQPSCDVGLRIISNTSSVSEGQDLQLMCQYCLASQVVWTLNNVILPSNYVEKSEESLTSTLTIKNILREQRGFYLCKIRSCEDCETAGVYVSVTGKPQTDVDIKQVVHVPGVNSSQFCGSRRGLLLLQYTVVPATELNTTLNDKN